MDQATAYVRLKTLKMRVPLLREKYLRLVDVDFEGGFHLKFNIPREYH